MVMVPLTFAQQPTGKSKLLGKITCPGNDRQTPQTWANKVQHLPCDPGRGKPRLQLLMPEHRTTTNDQLCTSSLNTPNLAMTKVTPLQAFIQGHLKFEWVFTPISVPDKSFRHLFAQLLDALDCSMGGVGYLLSAY